MNDKFTKFILTGILICLLIIAIKPDNNQIISPNSNLNINAGEQVVQLAPDRFAVIDNRSNSGMRGTVLVFDYDSKTKKFNYAGTFNYADYFSNPK